MSNDAKELASKVVGAFLELLDNDLREAVGKEGFRELHGIVQEALAERSEEILDRLEEDLKRLRAEMIERRPLEL